MGEKFKMLFANMFMHFLKIIFTVFMNFYTIEATSIRVIKITIFLLFIVIQTSCSLPGIHFKPANPKHAGSYPKATERLRLIADQTTKFRTCFDVKRYELWMTPDPVNKKINGRSEITSYALSDIDTLQLDLDERLALSEVRVEGQPVRFYRKYSAVFIIAGRTIKKNQRFRVEGSFSGKPLTAAKPPWKGGLVWKQDKNDKPWTAVACESEGASLWWFCKDVTNDEADTTLLHYTCNKSLVMVGNGSLLSVANNGQDRIYSWQVSKPINTYDITFYLGDFVLIEDSFKSISGNWVPIRHYALRQNEMRARVHFKSAKKILSVYENCFGAFPWQQDGYRLVESPYEGMEHQSAIAYGNGYRLDDTGDDYIILHETAHEWWGNAVSATDLGDVWLQEGFATFSEYLYMAYTHHADPERYMFQYWLAIGNKRPVSNPYNLRFFDYRDGDVYTKGAYALLSLKYLIHDDTLFMKIIRTFYERNKLKPGGSNTKDLESVISELTGKDYTWFFNQYFHSRKVPMLEYRILENEGIVYRWTDCDSAFAMPVKIRSQGDDYFLFPTTKTQFTAVPQIKKIKNNNLFWVMRQGLFVSIYEVYFGLKPSKKLRKEGIL